MSGALQGMLRSQLNDFTAVYAATYTRSYFAFDKSYPGYGPSLVAYRKIIGDNVDTIYRAAVADITRYIYQYNIHVDPTVDEFKCIYFLGMAIRRQLIASGQVHAARVHMFSMLGLLDYRLRTLGYDKRQLLRALLDLVREDKFDADLGVIGCYLIYKCVSTASKQA
jgi:hypothetical protein